MQAEHVVYACHSDQSYTPLHLIAVLFRTVGCCEGRTVRTRLMRFTAITTSTLLFYQMIRLVPKLEGL